MRRKLQTLKTTIKFDINVNQKYSAILSYEAIQ